MSRGLPFLIWALSCLLLSALLGCSGWTTVYPDPTARAGSRPRTEGTYGGYDLPDHCHRCGESYGGLERNDGTGRGRRDSSSGHRHP